MNKASMNVAIVLPLTLLLGGCDTEEALLEQRLEVAKQEIAALQEVREQLKTQPNVEGDGVASVFLSKEMLNSVLRAADGHVVDVPSVEGAKVRIVSMRAEPRLGFPLVQVAAVATKEGLDAELEVVGTARLQADVEAGPPQQLALRVHLDSFAPRARWGVFDFAVGGFVRSLMQVEFSEQMRAAGTIRVPVVADIPINVPAKQLPFSFQGARGYISIPELSFKGKVVLTRVLSLPDGLHAYGKVTM